MNKFFIAILLSLCCSLPSCQKAQVTLDSSAMEQKLQTLYKSYCHNYDDAEFVNNLISENCTPELGAILLEDMNGGSGYDFLTDGRYDYEQIASSVSVEVQDQYCKVSFLSAKNLSKDLEKVSLNIYFNSEGKISHIMRISDQYVIPENIPIENVTFK